MSNRGRASGLAAIPCLILAALFLALPGTGATKSTYTASAGLIPWKGISEAGNRSLLIMYEKFQLTHPDIDIVPFQTMALPGMHSDAAHIMSTAATAGPDISGISIFNLSTYAREGLIQPMDEYMDAWDEKDRIPPRVADALKIGGHQWGPVLDLSFAMLVATPVVFSQAGLKADDMPRTWDEVVKIARKLSSPTRAGFGISSQRSLAHLWFAMARQAGGEMPVRLAPRGIEVNLGTESSRRAAEFIARLGEKLRAAPSCSVYVASNQGGLVAAFVNGNLGLALGNEGLLYEASGWEPARRAFMAAVPGAFGDEPLAYVDEGNSFIMPSYIRSRFAKSLIWEFQTSGVWISRERDLLLLDLAAKVPTRLGPEMTIRYPDHPAMAQVPAHWKVVMGKIWPRAEILPPDREFEELSDILSPRLVALFTKGGSPAEELARAQEEFEKQVHPSSGGSPAKRRIAGAILAVFGILLLVALAQLVRTFASELKSMRATPGMAHTLEARAFAVALFLPAAALSLVFGVLPLVNGLRMSFSSHVLAGAQFTGLDNYFQVLLNPLTLNVIKNTAYFLLLSFILGFILPLVLSIFLAGFPRYRLLVRTVFFFPAVCSAVVVAILWRQIFTGPFNTFVQMLGFPPQNWLTDPSTAMFAVVISQSWVTLGASGLIYIAGLSAIPDELYEDAELSGAGFWERLTTVTIPHLLPLIGVGMVGWLISAVRTAEHVFLMTGGGPEKSTYVVGLDIFTQAYTSVKFGYAMAEVWLLVSVILILSIYQMRAVRAGQLRVGGH